MKIVVALGFVLMSTLTGCVSVALERDKVKKLARIDVVRVETPPMQVVTFMQALANSPQGAGLLTGAIAQSQDKTLLAAPAIPDLGLLIANGVRGRLPQQTAWWPQMVYRAEPVSRDYVHSTGEWLRIEIVALLVAPPPLRTVLAIVNVSLRDAANLPLWVTQKSFSGLVHGGERIDIDRLTSGDLSQVRREVERAADWLINEIVATVN